MRVYRTATGLRANAEVIESTDGCDANDLDIVDRLN